jgi:hypothetical protein
LIGGGSFDFGIAFPIVGVKGVEGIDEEFVDSSRAQEAERLGPTLRGEGVVMVPEGIAEGGE